MVDWSYVAGLFDHKGNINMITSNRREYLQLRLYSSHKETLEEVQKFLECGNIYHKQLSKKNKNWKDSFELTIASKEDIYIVLAQIYPYLIKKKQEVGKVLRANKLSKDFNEVSIEVRTERKREDVSTANNDETTVQTSEDHVSYVG